MYKTSNICYILARFDVEYRDQSSPAILNLIISRVSKESAHSVFLAVLVYRYLSALYPRHLSILCFFWRHISTSSEKKRGDMCVFTFTDKSSIVMKRCKIKY